MDFDLNFTDNLKLIETNVRLFDAGNKPSRIDFTFEFYGHTMFAKVVREDVLDDTTHINAEGNSELFHSFVDQIETQHWDKIKKIFLQQDNDEEE